MENIEKIAEVLKSKGWEVTEGLGTIFANRQRDDHGLIAIESFFITEKLRYDDSEPSKYRISYESCNRYRYSDNFFNQKHRTIQRSGDLNKTIARISNFVSVA